RVCLPGGHGVFIPCGGIGQGRPGRFATPLNFLWLGGVINDLDVAMPPGGLSPLGGGKPEALSRGPINRGGVLAFLGIREDTQRTNTPALQALDIRLEPPTFLEPIRLDEFL